LTSNGVRPTSEMAPLAVMGMTRTSKFNSRLEMQFSRKFSSITSNLHAYRHEVILSLSENVILIEFTCEFPRTSHHSPQVFVQNHRNLNLQILD
jgi:predicted nuclease of restriction endonuclease-like RecB superfamily